MGKKFYIKLHKHPLPILNNLSGLLVFSLLLFLLLLFLLLPFPAHAQHLTASGCSVSNVGYLSDLVRDYEKATGIKILVRGGGSVIGIEDLRSGKVDFAASCREKSAGDPEDMELIEVARDALVFITHKSNPTDNISVNEVRAIYAGRITNWKQLKGADAPIYVFVSSPTKGFSGVESSTNKMVLNKKDPVKTSNTVSLASTGIVEQMVEKTAWAFATTGFSSARKREVKMIKVGGITPSKENIATRKYPFNRPLFLVVPKKAKPEVRKFVDFALSKKGQALISSYGVVSLSDMK